MNKIIDYDHDTLIELINNALPQIEKQYTLLIEIDKLVKKYNELFRKREEQKSNFVSMLVATLVLLAIFIACIVTISKQFPSDLFNPILISFALFCIFIVSSIPIIYFSSRHSTQKK